MQHDIAVVGAGFAGLACARTAAARGLRTLVLERKPDPGARPHTTGLLTKEAAESLDPPLSLTRKIRRVRLYAPSLRSVDLTAPGYYFLATDTPGLLRWLADRAEDAGAHVFCDAAYSGPAPAPWLVGADGARSRVARDHGLGRNERFLVGVEAEFEGVGLDRDCLHCFLDSDRAPGYLAWAVPGVTTTQIGLACRPPARPDLRGLIRHLRGVFDFTRARLVSRRGGLIPVGGTVRPVARDRTLLVGDAAGVVSPLTAGGIHTALKTGRIAAHLLADHLLDGGLDPGPLLAARLPRFRIKRVLRALLDLRPPNATYDALLESRTFRALARWVFFHRGVWRWRATGFSRVRAPERAP